MRKEKNKFFDKIIQKDYNNKLEEVLSKKDFTDNVKSLLLDMFYKIETSYRDYSKVKRNVLSKEEYIQNLIRIINECNNIKIVQPNSDEAKILENKSFKIDKDKMEIILLPIERKMIYALSKIHKKEDIVRSKNGLLNISLTGMLNIGNNINNIEPLRDFNGFSWNIIEKDIENKYYNIIYQDLLILVDNTMFENWINNNNIDLNYLKIFDDILIELYGKELKEYILEELFEVSILLELFTNQNETNQFIEKKNELNQLIEKMKIREKFITELTNENRKMTRRIKKIDSIINNKPLLRDEYEKQNEKLPLEKKIFSMRILTKMLKEERIELLEKINENNKLMLPEEYIRKQKSLNQEYVYYKLLDTENIEEEILKKILVLQKYIIKSFKMKMKKAEDKNDIIDIIYQLRYYNLIPIEARKNISGYNELRHDMESLEKEVIRRAIELKIINEISKDEITNFNILKNIFISKIISLEGISLKVQKDKGNFYLQFFDEEVEDERIRIEYEINKKNLNFKLNKKIKVFL